MKLYKQPKQPPTVNINIKQPGQKTEHIKGVLGALDSVMNETAMILTNSGQFSPIAVGSASTVEFREYIDGKNGKTKSFKIYSNPGTIKSVIATEIEK